MGASIRPRRLTHARVRLTERPVTAEPLEIDGPARTSAPRIALVHYWLVRMRGGERVLEQVLRLFPEADIFTHVYDPDAISESIRARRVRTTFIDRLPASRRHYQKYLPLMPRALEELDLSAYDLVISFESGPAKGVITSPDALHVCYCHSPMRYLWDSYGEYRRTAGALSKVAMSLFFNGLRIWDVASAARVDHFMANSSFVQRRVRKVWRREATVVHPPAPTDRFRIADIVSDRYLWVGELTPYKRADIAVEAFTRLGLPLTVVGDGPMAATVKRGAGPNIEFIERLDFDSLRKAYSECRALVFTPLEDFGIVPVEAMAAGRPVLAYGKGGALDTVVPGVTGLLFEDQTVEGLMDGVRRMEAWLPGFDPRAAVDHAARFSEPNFRANFLDALDGFAADASPAIRRAIDDARVRVG
jgi:glycosyltransferase involved in cell wall biosynthesis